MAGHAVNNSLTANSAKPFAGQVFYLDTKSFKYTEQLETCILQLGGRVEKFLGKEVTRVISDRTPSKEKSTQGSSQQSPNLPPVLMSRGQRLLNKARHSAVEKTDSASSDLLTVAAQWNISIMPLRKILNLLKSYGCDVSKKENQLKQGRQVKLRKLNGPFIKFEHSSGWYKPCHMAFTSFPSFHFERDKYGGSPFCAPIPSRKPVINGESKKADAPQAPAGDDKKIVAGQQPGTPVKTGQETAGQTKQTNTKKPNKKTQSGYCECCDEWYKELKSHVASFKHQRFASNSKNYTCVDFILNELPGLGNLLQKRISIQDIIDPVDVTGLKSALINSDCKSNEKESAAPQKVLEESNSVELPTISSRVPKDDALQHGDANVITKYDSDGSRKSSGSGGDIASLVQGKNSPGIKLDSIIAKELPCDELIKTYDAVAENATSIEQCNLSHAIAVAPLESCTVADVTKEEIVDQIPISAVEPPNSVVTSTMPTNAPDTTEPNKAVLQAVIDREVQHVPVADMQESCTVEAAMVAAALDMSVAAGSHANVLADTTAENLQMSALSVLPAQPPMPGYDSHSEVISQMLMEVRDLSDNLGTDISMDDDYVRFVMCNQQTNAVLSADLQDLVSELGMNSHMLFDNETRSNSNEFSVSGNVHQPVDQSVRANGTFNFGDIGAFIPQENIVSHVMTPNLDLGFSESSRSDASFKPELHWEAIMKSLSEGPQENDFQEVNDEGRAVNESSSQKDPVKRKPARTKHNAKDNPTRKGKGKKTLSQGKNESSQGGKSELSQGKTASTQIVDKSNGREVSSSTCDKLYNRLDTIIDQVCGPEARSPVTRNTVRPSKNQRTETFDDILSTVGDQSSISAKIVQVPLAEKYHEPKTESGTIEQNVSDSSSNSFHGFRESEINVQPLPDDPSSINDFIETETGATRILSEVSSSSFHGFTNADILCFQDIQAGQYTSCQQGSSEHTIMYEVEDTKDLDFSDIGGPAVEAGSSQGTIMYERDDLNGDCDIDVVGSDANTRELLGSEIQSATHKEQGSSVSSVKNKDMMAEWLGDDAVMDNPYEDMMDTALHRSSDLCHTDISSSMRQTSLHSEASNSSVKMKISMRKKKVVSVDFSDSESLASPRATPTRKNTRSLQHCDTSMKKSKLQWNAVPSPKDLKMKVGKVGTPTDKALSVGWTVKHSGGCKLTFSVDRGLAKYKAGKPKVSRRRLLYDDDS